MSARFVSDGLLAALSLLLPNDLYKTSEVSSVKIVQRRHAVISFLR